MRRKPPSQSARLAIATLLASSLAVGQDSAWMNLSHIDRVYTYSVILRNGARLHGIIRSVTPDLMSLAVPSLRSKNTVDAVTAQHPVTVARLDVLQVNDGLLPFDILYSSRSSWRDVQAVPSHSREYLSITLKSGESVRGEAVSSADSQLSIKRSRSDTAIPKANIALVDYVRIKLGPANRLQEFPVEIFDPRICPFIFNVGVLRVPLFNSRLPEDDSVLQCPGSQ